MEQTIVDVVKTMYDGFGEGDIERAVSVVDANVEWVELFPFPGTYVGRDALLELFERVSAEFDHYEMDFDEWLVDDGRVAVLGTYRVRRRGRPDVFESRFVHVFWVSDGRVRRYEQITDTRTAQSVLADE